MVTKIRRQLPLLFGKLLPSHPLKSVCLSVVYKPKARQTAFAPRLYAIPRP